MLPGLDVTHHNLLLGIRCSKIKFYYLKQCDELRAENDNNICIKRSLKSKFKRHLKTNHEQSNIHVHVSCKVWTDQKPDNPALSWIKIR